VRQLRKICATAFLFRRPLFLLAVRKSKFEQAFTGQSGQLQ
jgi:hypothetical protein